VFDDFASKLPPSLHVYAMTRRGFGESGFLASVGHSIAGQEMSSIANRHPGRLAALVFLDAGSPTSAAK
jgi:hypothetical protein